MGYLKDKLRSAVLFYLHWYPIGHGEDSELQFAACNPPSYYHFIIAASVQNGHGRESPTISAAVILVISMHDCTPSSGCKHTIFRPG